MWRRWIVRISVILAVAALVFVSAAELLIGSGVRGYSRMAQERFPGERVGALIRVVDCETCNLRDRNHAVWALGQIADARALPVLEKYYTGERCDHLHKVCQYELKKALKLVRQGHNSEAFLWRWMLPH